MGASTAASTAFVLLAAAAAPAQAQWVPGEGQVQFSVLAYDDRQPGLQRVKVRKPALALEVAVAEDWLLEASAVVDTISGASPSYHNVAASAVRFNDRRKAGDLRATWAGSVAGVSQRWALGVAQSTESDYRSDTVSLNAQFDTANRNTTLSLGTARSDDRVRPVNQPGVQRGKRVEEWLLGVTHALTPTDLLQLNLTHFSGQGYFSDPYKLLDHRPGARRQTTLLLRWNHHVAPLEATLRVQARANRDSFGPRALTLGVEWVQPWRWGLSVTPALRAYRQTAADFYRPPDPALPDGALPLPPGFEPGGTLFSLDPRLGAFTAWTAGLAVSWSFDPAWSLSLKLEDYRQTRTPTPLRARWSQLGLTHRF